ncbi:MAG: hypothetical protein LBI18_11375 [Planctomycetaceae bacterium]|nr:hypothetical protein [Planctomycetaceae bacterium]
MPAENKGESACADVMFRRNITYLSGGQPFAERLHCRKAILPLLLAGNWIPNRLAIQIAVRKQGRVSYRRRDLYQWFSFRFIMELLPKRRRQHRSTE